jgi:antitoxin (DNA-binding transcriptional repressor) of toxin-antitoxin stability system
MPSIMVGVNEAGSRLDELIDSVLHGAEVIITREGRPVAALVRFGNARKAGSAKGLFVVPDDFDEPLEDFRDYM